MTEAPAITFLRPDDPPDSFPEVGRALENPDGLLAIGGDLSVERLLAAYRRGIFPWYEAGQPILWWSPSPRAVLFPDELHVSRSLRRRLRNGDYATSLDCAFPDVIRACASTRADTGTWITEDMESAYIALHNLGHAHSVETWRGDTLVGGLYGIAIGGMFFGESMFSRATDASKVALVQLVQLLRTHGDALIDCQMATTHLLSLGSRTIPRGEFLAHLARLVPAPVPAGTWRRPPRSTRDLLVADPAPSRLRGLTS